ncbi:MAG: serine--tRNA ligase [Candidatus Woesearchaeota archaeon]
MIDIKLIRDNPSLVKDNIKRKCQDNKLKLVDEILEYDKEMKIIRSEAESLRHRRNKLSEEINVNKKEGKDIKELLQEVKDIPEKIKKIEEKLSHIEDKILINLKQIPNIMSENVPIGKSDKENVEIKKGGIIKKFDFPIKNHIEILENLKLADWDASSKVSGTGFYYLKNELAILNQALIRFAIDFMINKKYEYIEPPLMLNEEAIFASMDKTAIEQSVYSIKDENLNLIGTSEQAVLAMHSNDTISESELPKKYFSYSMCFRKEIGAHGINEKGLWRTHQFNKVEQFVFCRPEDSEKLYDELMQNSEEILIALKIPYRIIEICSGDLADWKFRSADLEVWRPTLNEYGEVMSLSNCTEYQARKLNIRCVDKQGNKRVLHTLNDTALATSRIMVAIIENNQNSDGSIDVPEVLVQYMHGIKKIVSKENK